MLAICEISYTVIVVYEKHFVCLLTELSVCVVKGCITVHQQKCGVQIPLYPSAVNYVMPPGQAFPDVFVCHMIVLTGPERACVDFMQFPAFVMQLPVDD